MHFAMKYRSMTYRKGLLSAILAIVLFTACTKEPGIKQLSFPSFTAKVNGVETEFMSPVTAESSPNANGGYDLTIFGRKEITNDSTVAIRFIIPDFTRSGTKTVSYTLNTVFNGGFIETKTLPNSMTGSYHFFQQGALAVEQDANGYLKGSFHFVYFLFDKYGAKTDEVNITSGKFSDIIIER
jgi:hypothetical protein